MTLEALLYWLALRRDILVSADEIWWNGGPDRRLARALRRHRRGLRVLLAWSDAHTCCSPLLHRGSWYHASNQVYRCEMCEQLQPWIAA